MVYEQNSAHHNYLAENKIRNKILKILIIILLLVLFGGCQRSYRTDLSYSGRKTVSYSNYMQAQDAYMDGIVHNLHREWADAIEDFDRAIMLISKIELSSQPPELTEKIDKLLREIPHDYKIALSNNGSNNAENAPAIISMALDDELTSKTRKNLQKLISDLPEETGDYDYPVVMNDIVKEKIVLFQSESYKKRLNIWLGRSTKYVPMIKEVFKEEGIPQDLAYLPLIESGFSTKAYSWAQAMGIWQFISSTGKYYGLDSDWWIDERRDPEKSTRAAAKYLKTLYDMFGDWELALASYNCGENRVKRKIKEKGTSNFWELRSALPKETRNYVPLFNAALVIAKNPEKYGFTPDYQKPDEFDVIVINEPINLELAAEVCQADYTAIEQMNAELLRWCTPPSREYELKVPKGSGKDFHKKYAKIPDSKKLVWQKHKVQAGESLSVIAQNYRTNVSALVKANKLTNKHKLRIGQTLLVPVKGGKGNKVSYASASSSSQPVSTDRVISGSSSSKIVNGKSSNYVVKKGDTPSEIAEKHGITLASLRSANSLGKRDVINIGQVLTIPGGHDTRIKNSSSSIHSVGTYSVRQGDTPLHIAIAHDMTLNDFLDLNDMNKKSTIYPGQKVKVSGYKSTTSENIVKSKEKMTHTVKTGESLWTIADKYNASVSDIVFWNGYSSKNKTLYPGDKVTIMAESGRTGSGTPGSTSGKAKVAYTVQKGDNLWKIAKDFDVNIEDLKSWNKLNKSSLSIGDKLVVYTDGKIGGNDRSLPTPSTGKQVIHTVQAGDTLWEIARRYNTTAKDIMNQNQLADPSRLKIGDELKIFVN